MYNTRNKRFVLIALFSLVPGLMLLGWWIHRINAPVELVLRFNPTVGGEPLLFNQFRYDNPGGEGRFKVTSFQFFLSNIKLLAKGGQYIEPESYHLARFDNAEGNYSIVLPEVPRRKYETIELSIGVDRTANHSIEFTGDLDPNSRMAWSWDVGYKFVLFEGNLELGDQLIPLTYHVGFNENYQVFEFDLDRSLSTKSEEIVRFEVDLMKLFDGTSVVDMGALPSVKFDKADSRLMAGNYEKMLTLNTP